MQKAQPIRLKRQKEAEPNIVHFRLPGLLPEDQILALNLNTRTLSLLVDGPQQIMEQQFSVNEIRVMVPIMESYPHYCPYEVLLSYIISNSVTSTSVARCRQRLQDALNNDTWHQEMRPIRRALSSIRGKLHSFDLEISTIRERGCSITSLTSSAFPKEH
ncbi:hypothetical protein [Dictyobacter kobayashii]|uniref:OmpR/PhoB-type domain-containing protein n=1 Tax=Dictyobacter kobayashii TaxID=2014872 RepID=A0A402APQ7_9CHLR|nr:hypothetical protein [Dictyobacter kobayashii]GCE20970.1 hypothetical protein KDK_47700 [Dictyobacter kobayashii]